MKICDKCGAKLYNDPDYCTECGAKLDGDESSMDYVEHKNNNSGVDTAIKFFLILTIIFMIIFGILYVVRYRELNAQVLPPYASEETILKHKIELLSTRVTYITYFLSLLWIIPLTIHIFKKIRYNDYIGTGVKIVILIFVNLIAGILLLTRQENHK